MPTAYKFYLKNLKKRDNAVRQDNIYRRQTMQQHASVAQMLGTNRAFILKDTPEEPITKDEPVKKEEEARKEDLEDKEPVVPKKEKKSKRQLEIEDSQDDD